MDNKPYSHRQSQPTSSDAYYTYLVWYLC